MNTLLETLGRDWVNRLGWALLHSLWQVALAALVYATIRLILRRRSANARYLAACLMLVLALGGPVVTFCAGPRWLRPHESETPSPSIASSLESIGEGLGSGTRAMRAAALEWARNPLVALDRVLPVMVLMWAVGVGVGSCRWAHGSWRIRQLRTRETEPVPPVWRETLCDLQVRLELSRPVQLLQSALVEVPTVVGWLRPVILVPASTLTGLAPAQVEAILAHELAHVRRGDYLVNVLQNVIETLMFYHPAVWWLSGCIREEREHCCDDLVLEVCGDRLVYARALASLEDLRAGLPRLAFGAAGGPLLRRIRRLLGAQPEDRPAGGREYGGLALTGLGLALVLMGAGLMATPRCYQATARVRVQRDFPARLGSDPRNAASNGSESSFLQTECVLVQSDVVLHTVVEQLDLDRAWQPLGQKARLAKAEAIEQLRHRLAIRAVPGTELVEIRATAAAGKEAADLANAVAAAYLASRARPNAQSDEAAVTLTEQALREGREVAKLDEELAQLRRKNNLTLTADGQEKAPFSLTAEGLRRLEELRIESKSECLKQEALLESLKKLDAAQRIQVLPTTAQDTLLNELCGQLNGAELKLVALRRDYGPDHLEVRKATELVMSLREKINQRTEGIMLGLDAKATALKVSLTSLNQEVDRARQRDLELADNLQIYFKTKRDREQHQSAYESLMKRSLDVRHAPSELNPASLVDRALEPARPFSPNLPRAAAVMGSGFLMGMLGLWLVKTAN